MSKAGDLWRLARRHPNGALGAGLMALLAVAALAAPWLAPADPAAIAPFDRLAPPGGAFPLGADLIGRDVLSRTLYGAQVSLAVGAGAAALALAFGVAVGLLAGYLRVVDALAMRVMDALMAIPAVLLAVALAALWGASLGNVIAAIAIAETPRVARLVRGVTLSLRAQPYVDAAIAVGGRLPVILLRHILPNASAPIVVQGTYILASAILTEAILSFVGAGAPPSLPTWGNMIAEGRAVFQIAPHVVLVPGCALALTVLAVNLLGDGLRDRLDPRFASRR